MPGFKEQSPSLLACVLCLMIPGYISVSLRIFTRLRNKSWGFDDWCMAYAAIPFFVECLSGILGAYWGLGQHEKELSASELRKSLLWWNIFSFFYCNSMIPIKLGIAWQIGRIGNTHNNKKVMYVLYAMMGFNTVTLVAVFVFQLAQCHPVAFNWDKSITTGHCLNQKYLTVLSFTMSGINITTDLICACLPVAILWNIQMHTRKKILVGVLLCMGMMGSIAALVRLKYTVALNEATDFTFTVAVLACWTIAEPGIGYTAANLATLRPLFRKFLSDSSLGGSNNPSKNSRPHIFRNHRSGKSGDYLELEMGHLKNAGIVHQAEISAHNTRRTSSSSILVDSKDPQTTVHPQTNITVSREVQVTREMI